MSAKDAERGQTMLTANEIAAVVTELSPRVVGGQVQKVREPRPGTLVLSVRAPGRTTHMVICGAPPAPRISEADDAGETLPEPSHLGRWLRAALKGRRLETLEVLPGERVVILGFEAGRLVAELTGNSANLYGLSPEGRVQAAAHRSTGTRDLRPGRPWHPPEARPAEARPAEADPSGTPSAPRFASARAIEEAAGERVARTVGGEVKQARGVVLGRVRKRLENLWGKVAADVGRAEGADRWRRAGELLKTQTHKAKKGQTSVAVTDWYAPETPEITIELDPALDPAANVAKLFARYRKAQSGIVRANARLVEVEAQIAALDAIEAEHPEAEAEDLIELLRRAKLWRSPAGGGGGGRRNAPPPRKPYHVWISSQGERIYVGRGGADNHALTFHIARGNDWWLHIRDAPGAHVVVPMGKGGEPHPETLRDAAALAARHSDLKDEGVVTVTLTRRKHVRPVPGAAPGRVALADARSLTVEDPRGRAEALRKAED